MARHQDSTVKPYHFTFVISIICIALFALALPNLAIIHTNELLNYQYDAIEHGELWRLVTGNLLHTNGWHLAMNLAGFWVIIFLHELHYKNHTGKLILLFISLCLLEGIGLFLFYPSLKAYVGLSGLLHGLFTFGAIMDIKKGLLSGYFLLLGVIAKVAFEQYFGASDGISSLINARVATESHLIGVVAGLICALVWSPMAHKFKHSK
ncbi:rhombosortase [Shewanella aestuarii]|uniref:Rhombosortase n=1 Tax=Shewanella aestuarii TaxID=1028752 RepID=A0A6G9QKZ1_9GAMM|nr:rhombosortase [Shewanella aestuarii]QIR14511.1 rhombosortase [Shewanella aestuarii]